MSYNPRLSSHENYIVLMKERQEREKFEKETAFGNLPIEIVESNSIQEFRLAVAFLIERGYKPHGEMSCVPISKDEFDRNTICGSIYDFSAPDPCGGGIRKIRGYIKYIQAMCKPANVG